MTDAKIRIEVESNIENTVSEVSSGIGKITRKQRELAGANMKLAQAERAAYKEKARLDMELINAAENHRTKRHAEAAQQNTKVDIAASRRAIAEKKKEVQEFAKLEREVTQDHAREVHKRLQRYRIDRQRRLSLELDWSRAIIMDKQRTARIAEELSRRTMRKQMAIGNRIVAIERAWSRAIIMDKKRDAKIQEDLSKKRIRAAEQEARRLQSIYKNVGSNAMNRGNNSLFAGMSRMGGVFPGPLGSVARNAVTGGFIGHGLASKLGGTIAGVGRFGGPVGTVVGQALGGMTTVGGTLAFAKAGATLSIASSAFSMGARMFTRAVGSFTTTITNFASRITRMAVLGTVGSTVGGVVASSARQRAIQGMSTVLGENAPEILSLINQTAGTKAGSMFSRTGLIEAATGGAAFGFNNRQIRDLLPTAMNTSALTGEPIQESLRAFARAAFQGETERAESYLLNLRENKLKEMFGAKTAKGGEYDLNTPGGKARAVIEAIKIQGGRFEGGAERIGGTLPGALGRVRSRGTDALAGFGRGFEVGSDLTNSLNKLSDKLTELTSGGVFSGLGQGLGAIAGKGLSFLSNNIPSRQSFLDFFSTDKEGTRADQFGEMARATFAYLIDMANKIKDLLTGENGLFARMMKQWEMFKANFANIQWWQSVSKQIGQAIISGVGSIDSAVGSVGGALVKSGVKSIGQSAVLGIGGGAYHPGQAFAEGGMVKGPAGSEQKITAHAGEVILNAAQQQNIASALTGGSMATGLVATAINMFINNGIPKFAEASSKLFEAAKSFLTVGSGGPGRGIVDSASNSIFKAILNPPADTDMSGFGRNKTFADTVAAFQEEKKKEKKGSEPKPQYPYDLSRSEAKQLQDTSGNQFVAGLIGGNPEMVRRMAIARASGFSDKAFNPYTGKDMTGGSAAAPDMNPLAQGADNGIMHYLYERKFGRGPAIKANPVALNRGYNDRFNNKEALRGSVYDGVYGLSPMPAQDPGYFNQGQVYGGNLPAQSDRRSAMKQSSISYNFYGNVYNNGGPNAGMLKAQHVG